MKNVKNTKYFSNLPSKYQSSLLFVLITGMSLITSFNASALGQLMVSPTRIVFEGNEKTKQINLINNGSETGRFRISFVRKSMNSSGKIEVIDDKEPGMYSDEMVRFSPRQVTLEPGQSQTVRLMLRKKSNMADGEYRSHMMFQSLPDSAATDVEQLTSKKTEGVSIQMIPVVGIAIPVIVRQGKLNVKVSLSDFEIEQSNTVKAQSELSLKINRQGDRSAYGDFRVDFTPKGAEPVVIGQVNGVAVYTSTESRMLKIKLQLPDDFKLSNGELHVTYKLPGEDKKGGLIAESRLAIP
jgi:P pilus assembly chaperone PapD